MNFETIRTIVGFILGTIIVAGSIFGFIVSIFSFKKPDPDGMTIVCFMGFGAWILIEITIAITYYIDPYSW